MLRAVICSAAFLSLLGVARPAGAQPAGVSVADAVREAEAAAPDVVVSAARAASAHADVLVAGILPPPRLTVGTTASSATAYGSLFVALPLFGQRGSALSAAEAQAATVRAGVDVARLDAKLGAVLAWIDLWVAEREAKVVAEVGRRRERLVETTRVRFSEGAGSRLDVLRADTEARRARADATARDAEIEAASARVALLLGRPAHVRLTTRGEPPGPTHAPSDGEMSVLLDNHPVMRRAREALRAADLAVSREKRARWPLVGVQLGASFANRAPPPENDVSAALGIDLPVFSAPLVARAEAARGEATAVLAATLATLRSQLAGARASHAAAEVRYRAAVEEVLPTAKEAADLAAEGYRTRGLDLTSTLAIEQARADAELAAVRATADRARAIASLEHAAGRSL